MLELYCWFDSLNIGNISVGCDVLYINQTYSFTFFVNHSVMDARNEKDRIEGYYSNSHRSNTKSDFILQSTTYCMLPLCASQDIL